jgi:hypothetical protein
MAYASMTIAARNFASAVFLYLGQYLAVRYTKAVVRNLIRQFLVADHAPCWIVSTHISYESLVGGLFVSGTSIAAVAGLAAQFPVGRCH